MKTLTKIALSTVVVSANLMVANVPTQAALIGDTITIEAADSPSFPDELLFSEMVVVVDPGIEFFANPGTVEVTADIKADSIDFIYTDLIVDDGAEVGDLTWFFSDLDWVNSSGIITGVTQTDGRNANNISFTSNSITIDLPGGLDNGLSETFSFDIETQHVPEPSTMLGLLALAGLGLGSRFKGNKG